MNPLDTGTCTDLPDIRLIKKSEPDIRPYILCKLLWEKNRYRYICTLFIAHNVFFVVTTCVFQQKKISGLYLITPRCTIRPDIAPVR